MNYLKKIDLNFKTALIPANNFCYLYALYGFIVILGLLDIVFMGFLNLLGYYFREFLGIFGSFLMISLSAGGVGYFLILIFALLKSLKNSNN